MADKGSWTPYGLEAIRVRHLRRRRLAALLILGLGAFLILLLIGQGANVQTDVIGNGVNSAGNGISIDIPEQEEPEDGPVTVAISPGRITLADTQREAQGPTISRANVPTSFGASALNWNYYLLLYGPWALLGLAVWALAKRRGKHEEVNYGVHKGAMPLEMISAHASNHVFTTRQVERSLFGKRREDYLPGEVVRVPQEGDP